MSDNHLFDVPKCRVKYDKSLNVTALFAVPDLYTGPRYRVELVDGNTTYWAGEYPVSEFSAAVSTAHRVAKRAQTARYRKVSSLLEDMKSPKE